MRATLIHNPTAGTGRHEVDHLMAVLSDEGLSPIYCSAKDEALPKVLRRARGLVVAAGGDGTVARVVTQLPDRDIPIAILPLGTANNIARTFGIDGNVEDIVAGWKSGSERRLDVGLAEGEWGSRRFVEAVGLGALVTTTGKKDRGKGGVAKRIQRGRDAFRKVLQQAKPLRVAIELDDQIIKDDMLLVEIMNTNLVGPGLRLAPSADPGDGRLDVAFVPAEKRAAMLTWLDDPDGAEFPVMIETGRRVAIAESGTPFRVGDKVPERSERSHVVVALEHGAALIVVPPARNAAPKPATEGRR